MAEHATASRDQVTVILLGHEQAAHRPRALHYYQSAGVACRALDYLPGQDSPEVLAQRLAQALSQLESPYVMLALDADFVRAQALDRAAQVLAQTPQALGAQGYALAYRLGDAKACYHKVGALVLAPKDEGGRERLHAYALAGQSAWRAVLRVDALIRVLADLPVGLDFAGWQVALSYALLTQGAIAPVQQTDVICELSVSALTPVARDQQLAHSVRVLRQWDASGPALCTDEAGFKVLNRLVRSTYDQTEAPLLFTSPWVSVIGEPQRVFEPRQYVELPYYDPVLFADLTEVEFLCHAWPTGQAHREALEGTWVRQRELLIEHPNDTRDSLQQRYWKALALGLFNLQVCSRLVPTLTGAGDEQRALELGEWLERLQRIPGLQALDWLADTRSGQVIGALTDSLPELGVRRRALAEIAKRPGVLLTFIVLDLHNDDLALQTTFDSLLASGLRQFKLVVLKNGKPPAITTARDTLHFVQVSDDNWINHLNQLLRQLASEWLMLLDAGDELVVGGLLRLHQELAQAPGCLAVCANEVQRDDEGRLQPVVRPGSDLTALRSQPGLMSRHWCVRRQAVLDAGGYSEGLSAAFEFDLLLRLVEQHGQGCLAHMDQYLVVGAACTPSLQAEAATRLKRHLTDLGYRGEVHDRGEAGLTLDYRHSATPLVSILVAAQGDPQRLLNCLNSVLQRTRYPRYEVLVAAPVAKADALASGLAPLGNRVRLLSAESGELPDLLNIAAGEARGEHLLLLAEHCEVISPAWIEALLNEGLRPEVGVVGACLLSRELNLAHAGFDLLQGPRVHAPWSGLALADSARARWPDTVRGCAAVSADCMLIRRDLFDHCGGLKALAGFDVALCLEAAQNGLLVVWTPVAQLFDDAPSLPDERACTALQAGYPQAFAGHWASDALKSIS
ncbi:glycosyltransferase [Pseudomonas sp. S75]|uniref:glycosyltransferase n=1 Tax=unclassified Pseudomonas TaxID=196821 RepID=UPI001903D819|nr:MULTISPECIES: glycosyltransferase [unclassified Pseudomonas]MBJ9975449.1 glycosyltransferase [Pseudomonas sp. S30]MBK0152577.1 glycosyltransferase [Pseudomonas sp. S75]